MVPATAIVSASACSRGRAHDGIRLNLHQVLIANQPRLHQRIRGQDVTEAFAMCARYRFPVGHMGHKDARPDHILKLSAE